MPSSPLHSLRLRDLHATREAIAQGQTSAAQELERCIEIAQSPGCEAVFYDFDAEAARAQLGMSNQDTALATLPIGIKDLYDIASQKTQSGSPALSHLPAAERDAPAVARLRAAGGLIFGRTAQNQFAFSGMGINPARGTPKNATDAAVHRIPGGSSSGAGVAVATGAVFIGLGSDTGGSVRIPAAVNGVVGFKPTTGLIPTEGAVPLSTTLDTVGPLTRSVRDAALAFAILAQRPTPALPTSPDALKNLRIGVPSTVMLDALDPAVAQAFDSALSALSQAGAHIEHFALPELADIAPLQSKAGFSSVEGLAWHKRHGSWQRQSDIDPRVVLRMGVAEQTLATDYVELVVQRQLWIAHCEQAISRFDLLASPTVPITARPLAEVEHDINAFLSVNAQMLRNTSPVNFLGGPAISIPIHRHGELGVGLMLWSRAGQDDAILSAASLAEQLLSKHY